MYHLREVSRRKWREYSLRLEYSMNGKVGHPRHGSENFDLLVTLWHLFCSKIGVCGTVHSSEPTRGNSV
jgi:hypothetical protein